MSQRRVSLLMLVCSLVGGVIGFLVGEVMLGKLSGEIPQWLLMGLYFGQYAFFVGLMCLIAEMISPRLNGDGWKQRYLGFSWKMLVPSTFLMVGVVALLLQLLYGSSFQQASGANNIVMVLDTSGSMQQSDPDNQLFKAAADMVQRMDSDMNIAVVTFHDQTNVLQPLTDLSSQSAKDEVVKKLLQYPRSDGGTRIDLALQAGLDQLQANQMTNSTVVLMSDGYSDLDIPAALAPYKQNQVIVHTVGMSQIDADGTALLQKIAAETGGSYFNVEHADQMTGIFGQIYDMSRTDRNIVSERTGATEESMFYAITRVVSVLIIGALLGLALGLIFDNRHLAKSFTIGGAVSGLLAGLVLEMGLSSINLLDMVVRLLACSLLAVILTLFTLFVPASTSGGSSFAKRRLNTRQSPRALDAGNQSNKRFDL
ncbi:VWA domain-containing protein [Brevibacillus brevis]|uniref:VWA domain-containing protein n=1 Tax=Brevibacillus brevis TaxID=1393 RepID=A0A2Z4MQS8_BREBE|nr:vWA domain-containing protein [Brevibacillus brevis]AWX58896.1 VWA domain-containing protein [Brevibacillus brevis]